LSQTPKACSHPTLQTTYKILHGVESLRTQTFIINILYHNETGCERGKPSPNFLQAPTVSDGFLHHVSDLLEIKHNLTGVESSKPTMRPA